MAFPKTFEDNLIYNYWKKKGGSLFLEVPIGNDQDIWPRGSKVRRIDAIRVIGGSNKVYKPFDTETFKEVIKDKDVELIEAKETLCRYGYGQVVAGVDMFEKQYEAKSVKGLMLCERGDPALEIICKERNVEVHVSIDTRYNFQAETEPRDADRYSRRLREYHRILWSKPLPNGDFFRLESISRNQLYYKSKLEEFFLSSDRAVSTFSTWQRTKHIIKEIPKDRLDKFINLTETIGAITIWPSNRIGDNQTINGARGFNSKISDRLDLTLECIRRYYSDQESPLYDTLKRYDNFFKLFGNFKGYIDFFLFQDFVTNDYTSVKIAPPFDNFESMPVPKTFDEYIQYMEHTEELIGARNERIAKLEF